MQPSLIETALSDIEAQYKRLGSSHFAPDFKRASKAKLKRLEGVVGHPLPSDYETFLSKNERMHQFSGGYECLGVERVQQEFGLMGSLLDGGSFEDANARLLAQEDFPECINRTWWSKDWVPFAADSGGNLLCLDLAPTSKGVVGQVFSFGVHSGPQAPSHSSFELFLNDHLQLLCEGRAEVDAGIVYADKYAPAGSVP